MPILNGQLRTRVAMQTFYKGKMVQKPRAPLASRTRTLELKAVSHRERRSVERIFFVVKQSAMTNPLARSRESRLSGLNRTRTVPDKLDATKYIRCKIA